MWLRSPIQIRKVLMGVIFGLGVAGLLVAWKNEGVYTKQKSTMKYNAGE